MADETTMAVKHLNVATTRGEIFSLKDLVVLVGAE